MPYKLTFLSASLPLTKTIEQLPDGTIFKSPYPLVSQFTTETVEVSSIQEFYQALVKRANSPKKPCLLKGTISRELVCESRKGTTSTNDSTHWVCLDVDDAKFTSPEEVVKALGLEDVSYVVQYSASHKLAGKKTLSCHIFMQLDKPLKAPEIKAWLMHMNLTTSALESNLSLSKSHAALHWPLDITACQNDKLLYIAQPVFKGMKAPIPDAERIQLVTKKKAQLPTKQMELKAIEGLKKQARDKLNTLRNAAGIQPLKVKTKMVGEYEVQAGVGEIASYEVIDCGDYNRLNLNGGDSQAYWHYKSDPTYLHNFKGEPSLLIKEVLPHYYADLVRNAKDSNSTPSFQGDLLLAFREKKTAAYWKGIWNPDAFVLELYPVKSELQLDHFLQGHGRSLGAFVPEWDMIFDPQSPVIVDEVKKVVNTFVPTEFMREGKKNKKGNFPIIQRILDSAVGLGEVQDHFLNWLAVVWQQRQKPLTAWVLHGDEGTGKGLLFHKVLRPLFGRNHAVQKRATELGSQYNGWLEQALIVFIDEIEADMFINARAVEADLRTMITEPTASIRRMRTDSYEVPNFSALIFSSNKKRPVAIPPGDRRFNIGVFQPKRLAITSDETELIADELEHFARFLSDYKADFNRARSILQTEDRKAIQDLSVTSVDRLAQALMRGNFGMLLEAMPDERLMQEAGVVDVPAIAFAQMVRRMATESLSRITRDELRVIFQHCIGKVPEGAHKFSAFLRHHGIALKRIRFCNQLDYGLEVEWVMTAEERDEVAERLKIAKPEKIKRVK